MGANFAGSIWQVLMGLVFIPFYIKFMGVESYGLIGMFATLQVLFGLSDLGLGSTLTREMARLSALPSKGQEMRDLVRTLEILYWIIAVMVGIAIVLLSPRIAHQWIKAGQLAPQTIQQAFYITAFVMVFQLPIGFYSGGLVGLQKQALLNIINGCMSTWRGAGAVLVLGFASPTIQAYLFWQLGSSILNAFLLAFFLWRTMPLGTNKPVFEKKLLKGVWKFSAGMSGISILAVILTQLDKVILSTMLSLEMFGYYMLASMVAMSLARLFTPVFSSIYPKFTQLVAVNDHERLKRLYHDSCQFIAVLILPAAVVIALFSYEVIFLWTQNPETAEKTRLILSIMILGTALNGLMNPPYALQLAYGWTRLSIIKTLIAAVLLVPLIIYLTFHYGAKGAAFVWLILNVGMVFFEIPIMHLRILRKEKWKWYWQDVGIPLMGCAFISGMGRLFLREPIPQHLILPYLVVVSAATLLITAIATSVTRSWLYGRLSKIKFSK